MSYQILFLDIDGTILKPDHTYTASTKDAIDQVQQRGIRVFLCTGRPLHELGSLASELNVDSLIGCNGSYGIHQNETIIHQPLNPNTVRKYLDIAKEHNHKVIFYTKNGNYHTSLHNSVVQSFIKTFDLTENHLFDDDVINEFVGGHVINVRPSEKSLYNVDGDMYLVQVNVDGHRDSYDIVRRSVNKGQAAQAILEKLNIPKEQAIAFGDGMNDKEMLQAVGEGFAMGNAHPDLFAYAKYKTTTVENSGIYNGLKKLGLVE